MEKVGKSSSRFSRVTLLSPTCFLSCLSPRKRLLSLGSDSLMPVLKMASVILPTLSVSVSGFRCELKMALAMLRLPSSLTLGGLGVLPTSGRRPGCDWLARLLRNGAWWGAHGTPRGRRWDGVEGEEEEGHGGQARGRRRRRRSWKRRRARWSMTWTEEF